MKKSESEEQIALFQWAEVMQAKYPKLKLLHAIPNGGHRHIAVARKLKAEGVKSGVPDIFLPVANIEYGYCGLYIEMKVGKNKPTENQLWWIENLQKEGYQVEVCYSFEEAKDILEDYLKGC